MTRWLPRSLFGRLMVVLAGGLIVAQLLSAAINYAERDRVLIQASGMQPAQRIADIVKLLDSLRPEDRQRIVGVLNVPPLIVTLLSAASVHDRADGGGVHEAIFSALLRSSLGGERRVQVHLKEA